MVNMVSEKTNKHDAKAWSFCPTYLELQWPLCVEGQLSNPSKQRQKKHQPKQQGSFGFQVTIRCVEGRIWNTVHISFKLFFKEISWMESLHNSTKTPLELTTKSKKSRSNFFQVTPWSPKMEVTNNPWHLKQPKRLLGRTCLFPPKQNSDWISCNMQPNRVWTGSMFLKIHRSTCHPLQKVLSSLTDASWPVGMGFDRIKRVLPSAFFCVASLDSTNQGKPKFVGWPEFVRISGALGAGDAKNNHHFSYPLQGGKTLVVWLSSDFRRWTKKPL